MSETKVRHEKAVEIANALAAWIDASSLPPSDLHPVYDAHVLLCALIEAEASAAKAGEASAAPSVPLNDERKSRKAAI